ncbi:aminoglycoside 6-adenylyltransferase [Clostridium sp. LP20]|uniref:aminoglycoside 6-adenylyltransferase n=1 Tax=Clostridium sp. LP20 TaxID=3418665 RepID=UPI003EE4AFA6
MRREKEMMDLLLKVASKDERIRAVFMNGSRTNINVPKDIFQDYDIVYVVKETESFIEDEDWIKVFGEILYMQKPEEIDKLLGEECNISKCYGYLMQLADGNRLDLRLMRIDYAKKMVLEDKLAKILLDKDKVLPEIPEVTDEDYHVKRPDEILYYRCCNEFWWCLNNVAKGLWREEIPYVMDMLDHVIRPELKSMLIWNVGIDTNFSLSVGKSGKYLKKYLSEDIWRKYLETYSVARIEAIWDSVFIMCDLFEVLSRKIAKEFSFKYNEEEARNSLRFLKNVRELPKDAIEVL